MAPIRSPEAAIAAARPEELVYVVCIFHPERNSEQRSDYVATIDVDPTSDTYQQIVARSPVPSVGDQLHHTGWNACASSACCAGSDESMKHRYLVAPSLVSSNIFFFDVSDQRSPKLAKTISGAELAKRFNISVPHTVHCAPNGTIMISCLGDANRDAQGSILEIDAKTLDPIGLWSERTTDFAYDFWYQPKRNVMLTTGWASPKAAAKGFSNADVEKGLYSQSIHVWRFNEREHIKEIKLNEDGLVPLEVRFLHNPDSEEAFFCTGHHSNIFRVHRDGGEWQADNVVDTPSKKVEGWREPEVNGILSDILISMDDRFLYSSNYLQGDVRQYDISTPERRRKPLLVGQCFLGGVMCQESGVRVTDAQGDEGWPEEAPRRRVFNGKTLYGGAQMMQLSIDGRRLYVTTSLYTPWDSQFFPDMIDNGSAMFKIDVDVDAGGLKLDENFLVDFGDEPGKPMAHEIRYPGGDCTSDIYC